LAEIEKAGIFVKNKKVATWLISMTMLKQSCAFFSLCATSQPLQLVDQLLSLAEERFSAVQKIAKDSSCLCCCLDEAAQFVVAKFQFCND